jgi:hypothetical protein
MHCPSMWWIRNMPRILPNLGGKRLLYSWIVQTCAEWEVPHFSLTILMYSRMMASGFSRIFSRNL